MADFSFLSDTDESAVEEILAEAADHVALKQISALNLSGVSDSVLPQHLESRFRRLKSLPSSLPKQQPPPPASAASPPELKPSDDSAPKSTDSTHNELASSSANPKSGSKAKSRSRSSRRRRSRSRSRSPSPSPSSSSGSSTSSLEPKTPPKLKPEKGFGSNRRLNSVSPPAKKKGSSGLWRSLKTALKKMSFTKRSGRRGGGEFDWGVNDGVLEGIGVGSLSRKEQEKILKRAAKEEMKISQEAEKIAKLAKHVSARMEAFGIVDDDDELHYK